MSPDPSLRKLFRRLKTAVRPELKIRHTPPKARKRLWPYAAVALPKYDGPVLDRRGERAVFARFRYYSRRTARPGVSQRVVLYVFQGAEVDPDGEPYVASNVGLTIDEALCAFDHLEQINWSAQEGAKILMHGILAMDYRQTPDEMMDCAVRRAELTFGQFDLPYLVTLHAPPEDGDQRNWHAHVVWSFRPMVRTGDHEWFVGEMLRTDLDNPQAMKLMREAFAGVMTDVSFEAGQKQVWTAKSNAARGLVDEPQVHAGAALVNRAREGEFVAIVEENHERVMRSKAARLDEDLRHLDEDLARRQVMDRAILARWARIPELLSPVPGAILAAATTIGAADIARPLPGAPDYLPSLRALPNIAIEATATSIPTAPVIEPPLSVEIAAHLRIMPPSEERAEAATPKTANLRILPAAPASTAIVTPPSLPIVRSFFAGAVDIRGPSRMAAPPVTVTDMPEAPQAAAFPAVPHSALRAAAAPLSFAPVSGIDAMLDRVADLLARADRKRDEEAAELARLRAEAERADRERRLAVARLLDALWRERHLIALKDGRPQPPKGLLDRFGVAPGALTEPDAKRQLTELIHRQNSEASQIESYVRAEPGHLRPRERGWTLSAEAPEEIRLLVEAWSHNPSMAAMFRATADSAVAIGMPSHQATPPQLEGDGWLSARRQRERALADWDDEPVPNRSGLRQPGRASTRPSPAGEISFQDEGRGRSRPPAKPGKGLGD